jgi:ATP-dependent DNA helicase PIF1
VHSALLLGTSKFTTQPLTQDKLNTLRTKLSNLQLLIIDEISMVGSNMLHKCLQQLKGKGDDTLGNISILAVGDLYQLWPVAQPHVFAQVGDAYARLHKSGSLWLDEFKMIELDEIMRQRGDSQFAQLLCRVRTASCT